MFVLAGLLTMVAVALRLANRDDAYREIESNPLHKMTRSLEEARCELARAALRDVGNDVARASSERVNARVENGRTSFDDGWAF